MTQLRGMFIGAAALLASACASSTPAADGGEVITAGSGAIETSLAAASGVVAGITAADLPACTRDPAIAPHASLPACGSWRTYLDCEFPSSAARELCSSDDPERCPDRAAPAQSDHCQMLCAPNEYAVVCVGPHELPAGCHTMPGPGGGQISCCPCL